MTDPTQIQDGQGDMSESADVPLSFFCGKTPKEGDSITVKVLSVDQENGMATIECSSGESEGGGIDGLMAKSDQTESEQ